MKLKNAIGLLAGVLTSTASFAQVCSQPWDGVSPGLPSQREGTALDVFCFDDFQLTTNTTITRVTIFGHEQGMNSFNYSVHVGFATAPNANSVFVTYTGVQIGEDLVFPSLNLPLPPGKYYVTAFVVRPVDAGGRWYWKQTMFSNPNGNALGEAYIHNPGNGWGWGINPVPVSTVTGVKRQMAMLIQ